MRLQSRGSINAAEVATSNTACKEEPWPDFVLCSEAETCKVATHDLLPTLLHSVGADSPSDTAVLEIGSCVVKSIRC